MAGLGIFGASAREVKRLLKSVSKKKPSPKKLEKLFASLIKEGEVRQAAVLKKIKSVIKDALKELDIPTRSELQKLESKVNKFAKK